MNSLVNYLRTLPNDVTIICSDGKLSANSLLLSRNEVFQRMLNDNFKESGKTITFPTRSHNVVGAVINHLQFGKVPSRDLSINDLLAVLAMAEEYQMSDCLNETTDVLRRSLTEPNNSFKFYDQSRGLPYAHNLREEAFKVIQNAIRKGYSYFGCGVCKEKVYEIPCVSRRCTGKLVAGSKGCTLCGDSIKGYGYNVPHEGCKALFWHFRQSQFATDEISEETRAEILTRICENYFRFD